MRSYTCIVDKRTDGSWTARFPTLEGLQSVTAPSKRKAKKKSFRALISFLRRQEKQGRELPKDTSTTYFHRVDVNRLDRYPSLEHPSGGFDLR